MAVQLQVAYSRDIKASAIFAGGPYGCAQGNVIVAMNACMTKFAPGYVSQLEQKADEASASTFIDPLSHLQGKKAYLFSGSSDAIIDTSVVRGLKEFYQHYGVQVTSNFTTNAGHAWISPDAENACNVTQTPFLNSCGIDPEATFLKDFYGPLRPRNNQKLSGSLLTFDQNLFFSDKDASGHAMDETGYVYVPAACSKGAACKLLVALHGCEQGASFIGTTFVKKSGFNEWADTNGIIILYPQAIASVLNPKGCWDWWGYLGLQNYAFKDGPQMQAIHEMIMRI